MSDRQHISAFPSSKTLHIVGLEESIRRRHSWVGGSQSLTKHWLWPAACRLRLTRRDRRDSFAMWISSWIA